jgi:glycosyltransferase involved in cell wall biosynthesis
MGYILNPKQDFPEKMKKVLMVTYFFPPSGGVKVQRVLKFAKYLPCFGWEPIILTTKNPQYDYLDFDLLREIPMGTKIQKTFSFEPAKIYKSLRSTYRRLRDYLRQGRKAPQRNSENLKRRSWASKMASLIFIPDSRIGWWPFAFFKILGNFKRNDFDVIYSTSPMFTSHLIAMAVKHVFKKPWVVDLRDLWILNPYVQPPTKLHSKISRYIEYKTFELADKIVTVSEELREDLIQNYPEICSEKFIVIPNGYDQADFEEKLEQDNGKFSIGYIGSLYLFSGRTPYYFLVALGELVKQFPQLEKEMEVTFIGPLDKQNRIILKNTILKFNLKEVVRQRDPVYHREAIRYIKSSALLLLIVGKKIEKNKEYGNHLYDRTSVTGKLFEYLASGNPILALAGEGSVKRIITETDSGCVVDPEDVEGIKEAILSFYRFYKQGKLKIRPKQKVLRSFQRKKLTGDLAKIFDELIERGGMN